MRSTSTALVVLACLAAAGCGTEEPNVSGAGWPNATLGELRRIGPDREVVAQPVAVGSNGARVHVQVTGAGVEPCDESTSVFVDDTPWPVATSEPGGAEFPGCIWSFDRAGAVVGSINVIVESAGLPYSFRWALP